MAESAIFLVLAYAIIVVQGEFSTSNVNTNMNTIYRRGYIADMNNDLLNSKPPVYYDDVDENPKTPLDEIRDKLYAEGNPEVASAATAAAEAAMTIAKMHAADLSESTGVGVADAVARILTDRVPRGIGSRSNRRNGNYNSNSNMNIIGRGYLRSRTEDPITDGGNDRITSSDLMELENSLGSILGIGTGSGSNSDEVGSSAFEYPSDASDVLRTRGTGGIYRDDDDENSTLGGELVLDDSLEDENATSPPKPVGSRGWDRPKRRNYITNTNTNVNTIHRRAFRRNLNNNVNTNTNTFRRNLNSNTNTNIIHRKNKINRLHRYRRD